MDLANFGRPCLLVGSLLLTNPRLKEGVLQMHLLMSFMTNSLATVGFVKPHLS